MAYLLSNISAKNYWNRTTKLLKLSLVVGWCPFFENSVYEY